MKTPTVLITGASGNIGRLVASKLKHSGYRVYGTTSSANSAKTLVDLGIDAKPLDLTDEDAVTDYIRKLSKDTMAAVLTVGGFITGDLRNTCGKKLRKMNSINFETAFFVVKDLLPLFERRGGGQIILIGAKPALNAEDGKHMVAYSISKKMVMHLSELINAYGKGKNIHSTVIVPGTIDTQKNREAQPEKDFSKWVSPKAIADLICFLLSDSGTQVRESTIKLFNNA